MSGKRPAARLRRYKVFRELEARAAWLSEQLEERTADLEQCREEAEWTESSRKLAEQRASK